MKSLKTDWFLNGPVFFLMAMGLLSLASIDPVLFWRQVVWAVFAVILILGFPLLNLRAIFSYRWVILGIYFAAVLLLVITYFFAPMIAGTKSWLAIGSFRLQPSEFMKAALIILFSAFFANRHVAIARLGTITVSFVYFLIPAVLILIQPDLGTALVIFGIWFGYLLVSEIPLRYLVTFFMFFILIAALSWNFGLEGYQKERITALFNPSYDPLGVNYNVIQSKIAIGSAGFFGKGFMQGTQLQSGFLPAASTDFIFASFVEEWGILGGIIIIIVFLLLIYRILIIGLKSDSNFYRFISLGTVIMLLIHFTINLGSNLGLLPVIGVSLPLVSYGGSNLLTVAALVGILQNIAEKRAGF